MVGYKKMRLFANVFTANRPNYLYVCLDAIFRNTMVPNVCVYIDKLANGDNFNKELFEVISNFDVRAVFVNKSNNNIGRQFWYSFENGFSLGADFCVTIEDDWLVTTDAFQWLYECPKIAPIYSLYRWQSKIGIDPNNENTVLRHGEHLSWCVGFPKESFEFINNIRRAKAHYGIHDFPLTDVLRNRYDDYDWDVTTIAIARHYKLTQLVPPRSLLAHFGNKTSIENWGYGSNATQRDAEMFAGDRSQWVANIAKMFETLTEQEINDLCWAPVDFRYK